MLKQDYSTRRQFEDKSSCLRPLPPAGHVILIKNRADTAAQFIASPLNLKAFSATNAQRGFPAIIAMQRYGSDEQLRWFPNRSHDLANPAS